MALRSGGYIALLGRNRDFRRLWYGQVTSQLGDWFDLIALFALLLRLTNSAQVVAGVLVAQALPSVLVGLGAGVVIDRLPRKGVLIVTDLGRAGLVLLYLLVREPDQVWIVYVVTFLKFTLSSFFEPAREAVIPGVVPRADLVLANSLSGITWSVMLAGGAALGGVVTDMLGTDLSFLLDAASFAISAACTASVPIRETHLEGRVATNPWHDLGESFRYLRTHRDVVLYILSKTFWSLGGGGVLVLLPLFGKRVFPLGTDGSLSMGVLYAARGVGAGLGPVLAHHWGGSSVRFLRRALGPGFFLMALGYLLFSQAPSLPLAACAILVAHSGGSIQWVFSTALVQLQVPNRLQGRIFAIELTLYTLMTCLSTLAVGAADQAGYPPRNLALVLALLFVPPGVAFVLRLWPAPVGGSDEAAHQQHATDQHAQGQPDPGDFTAQRPQAPGAEEAPADG